MTDHANTGNTNAQQEAQPKESLLVVRLTRARKGAYIRAARPGPLAPWVQKHLDRAAGYKPSAEESCSPPTEAPPPTGSAPG